MVSQVTLRPWILVAVAGLVAACATAPQGRVEGRVQGPVEEQAADQAAVEALGEMADPFILTISAERYVYLMGLAREGAAGAGSPPPSSDDPNDLARATRATIDGLRDLYLLRDEVCLSGLVSDAECGPLPPPDWLGAPVGEVADVVEINRRIDWLVNAMEPFVDAGCTAGDARQGDEPPYFCSVE